MKMDTKVLLYHTIFYEIDKVRLKSEGLISTGYEPFVDPLTEKTRDQWLIKKVNDGYAQEIANDWQNIIQATVKPRFYIQKKGFTLPWHRDRGTTAGINFVLTTDKDAVQFRSGVFPYKQAILDVTEEHQVQAMEEDRLLFKLSVFDKSFRDVVNAYESYYKNV